MSTPMQIAALPANPDNRDADLRMGVMAWFETVARAVLIAVVVLIGASIVRNVTDTLTTVATHAHAPVLERSAMR
jgi:hypothetical protein